MIIYYVFCGRKALFDRVVPELAKEHLSPLLSDDKNVTETKDDQEQYYVPPIANSSI